MKNPNVPLLTPAVCDYSEIDKKCNEGASFDFVKLVPSDINENNEYNFRIVAEIKDSDGVS